MLSSLLIISPAPAINPFKTPFKVGKPKAHSWNYEDDFNFCEIFEVDMLEMMFVSGVATQGCMINDSWVRSYKFVYRGDGKAWTKYTEADTEQVRISLY